MDLKNFPPETKLAQWRQIEELEAWQEYLETLRKLSGAGVSILNSIRGSRTITNPDGKSTTTSFEEQIARQQGLIQGFMATEKLHKNLQNRYENEIKQATRSK